jgi:hypothetical protein
MPQAPPWTLPSPPPQAPAPPLVAMPPEQSDEPGSDSPSRQFLIGAVVGVGLPNLLNFGLTTKLARYFGLGFNVGLIPKTTITLYGEATLKYRQYDAYARLYPFGGALFLGAGFGYASAKGTLTRKVDLSAYQPLLPELPASVELVSDAHASALVLTPQVGLFHTLESGFSVGLDAGLQVPVKQGDIEFSTRIPPNTPQEVTDRYVTPNDEKVRETLDAVARKPLPIVNLRVGWLF